MNSHGGDYYFIAWYVWIGAPYSIGITGSTAQVGIKIGCGTYCGGDAYGLIGEGWSNLDDIGTCAIAWGTDYQWWSW